MRPLDSMLLRVNLSQGTWNREDARPYAEWLGGQGLNQFILFNELPSGLTPYDSANLFAVGTGALVGTDAPGATRTNIDTLNTFTGGIGSGNAGGNFARQLRFAGLSNIVFSGKADRPVFLRIDDDTVEIRSAVHLAGKRVADAARILKDELGEGYSTLLIGPAGENLVRSACVIIDETRSASRCGLGAVMGSKNLKAVAVRGSGKIEASDPSAMEDIVRDLTRRLLAHPFLDGLKTYGVYHREPYVMGFESPYRNFSGLPVDPEKKKWVSPDAFAAFRKGTKRCGNCPVGCWKVYEGDEAGQRFHSEALHVNAIHNFAARLDMWNPEAVLKAHALCNDLGLDQDNVCAVISWAFECWEKGLIGQADTGGLDLTWGNEASVFRLIEDIALKQGFGELLSEGCLAASKSLPGTEPFCVHVKGQDLFESIWISPAWALGTVVAARGGSHTRGAALSHRLESLPPDICRKHFGVDAVGPLTSYENKDGVVFFFEMLQALSNSLGVCYFMHGLYMADMILPEDYARLYHAATGEPMTEDRMRWLGERIFNLEKGFNVLHADWTRTDDLPPRRFLDQPLDGQYRLDLDAWQGMLTRYYERHGWDGQSGNPLPETLDRLDLGFVKKALLRQGKI